MKILIINQQNYIMNSRRERHKEYSDSRIDKKKLEEKEDNEQDGSSLKYLHVICIVH